MTIGEKNVWAAAYVKRFNFDNIPPEVCAAEQAWKNNGRNGESPLEFWENTQAATAAAYATAVVERLRTCLLRCKDAFGEDNNAVKQLTEILGNSLDCQ